MSLQPFFFLVTTTSWHKNLFLPFYPSLIPLWKGGSQSLYTCLPLQTFYLFFLYTKIGIKEKIRCISLIFPLYKERRIFLCLWWFLFFISIVTNGHYEWFTIKSSKNEYNNFRFHFGCNLLAYPITRQLSINFSLVVLMVWDVIPPITKNTPNKDSFDLNHSLNTKQHSTAYNQEWWCLTPI